MLSPGVLGLVNHFFTDAKVEGGGGGRGYLAAPKTLPASTSPAENEVEVEAAEVLSAARSRYAIKSATLASGGGEGTRGVSKF